MCKTRFFAFAVLSLAAAHVAAQAPPTRSSEEDKIAHTQSVQRAFEAVGKVRTAVEAYRLRNNAFPASNAQLGLNPPDSYRTNDLKAIAVSENGTITATLAASSGVDGGTIRLTPKPLQATDQTTLEWNCVSPSYSTIADMTGGICEFSNQP